MNDTRTPCELTNSDLPSLPEPGFVDHRLPGIPVAFYTAQQTRAAQRAAIAVDRTLVARPGSVTTGSTLPDCMAMLILKHGGVRPLARAAKLDHGYVSRLHTGEKVEPSPETLAALGITRRVSYEVAASTPPAVPTRAAPSGWRPIETAPRDGTAVLGSLPDSDIPQPIRYHADAMCWQHAWDHHRLRALDAPTHWMPLPAAPGEQA